MKYLKNLSLKTSSNAHAHSLIPKKIHIHTIFIILYAFFLYNVITALGRRPNSSRKFPYHLKQKKII